MKGKWHRRIGMKRGPFKPHFVIDRTEDAAKRALPVVVQDSTLQKQLLLLLNRKVVDRGVLGAVCKGGLTKLINLGLVAGEKGGKKFFITPAGTIVLRELGQSHKGL